MILNDTYHFVCMKEAFFPPFLLAKPFMLISSTTRQRKGKRKGKFNFFFHMNTLYVCSLMFMYVHTMELN